MSGDLKRLPGHPRERGQGLYGRGSDEFMDGFTAVGLGILSIGRLPRQMTDGFPLMRSLMGTNRRCRCCHFSSRPTTECPDSTRVIPVPACVIS